MKAMGVSAIPAFEIKIDEEGILRLRIRRGVKINEEDIKKIFNIIRDLSKGKKVLELIEDTNFFYFDQSALKYAAKHGKEVFLASALVNKSIGVRILFNFFNTFFKHSVPFKMFSDEKSALEWLCAFRN
jgi:hypothetical protein